MIEFISCHPVDVPLTKEPNPSFLLRLLTKVFECISVLESTIEVYITRYGIIEVTQVVFLKVVGILPNPYGFIIFKTIYAQFQEVYVAKEFKKSYVPGLWTFLMHIIVKGLLVKHGGSNSISKDWLYLVYNIFTGCNNAIDLPEVIWSDFRKCTHHRKQNEIPCPIFHPLTWKQIYTKMLEHVSICTTPTELYYTFKVDQKYRLPNQTSFSCVQRLP